MKTQELIKSLRNAADRPVVFMNEDGTTIHGGYHLTEVKAAEFSTVDCGAQKNRWNETIVQLWVPEGEESDEFMTAQKFLSIYDKVSKMIDVDPDAEIRVEYGDENFFPSNYHVDSINADGESVRVTLRPPQTTCKARDRRAATGAGCC